MGHACFHCHEPIPAGLDLQVEIDGVGRSMCCHGCSAAATLIAERGLGQFYALRDAPSPRPDDDLTDWSFYDRQGLLQAAGQRLDGDRHEFILALSGINCAACSWLIETALLPMPGISELSVNPATGRARVTLEVAQTPLSDVLAELDRLGYRPRLLTEDGSGRIDRAEQRAALRRLVVAGFGMMQVMTYAVALYAGYFQDMDAPMRDFFRLVSLVVATPVVIYAGWPFIRGAWRGLRHRTPGMDVPVALAILCAYGASAWSTFTGGAEVYFDSAVMFVFLLSVTRWIEMRLRHRAAEAGAASGDSLPLQSLRRDADGRWTSVATAELLPGDQVRVATGEMVPADGRVIGGAVEVDESLLTGESRGVPKSAGQTLVAGSTVLEGPAEMVVLRTGRDTLLSAIRRLMEKARADRPRRIAAADRLARYLVVAILGVTALTALAWWQIAPARAFEVALAVLVITCPCALSLATPAVLSAAMAGLARRGILVLKADALETLAAADRIVFDKTGTLTTGRLGIATVRPAAGWKEERCRRIAAALEQSSRHPLASAFVRDDTPAAQAVRTVAGQGLEGTVEGRTYRIGNPAFALGENAATAVPEHAGPVIALADEAGLVAWFLLAEDLRSDAATTIRSIGLPAVVLSGDDAGAVTAAAGRLPLDEARARQGPEDKLAWVRECQRTGDTVIMVGDGCNDAPVLAQADASVAVGTASALAGREADVILTSNRLTDLVRLVRTAHRVRRLIGQNLTWALTYNLAALPLAAAGVVPPWLAAIGMSASSLLVVGNSLRAAGTSPEPVRPGSSVLREAAT